MERNILAFHILPKLPVKSLIRFKSVCKEWFQLISDDPAFLREQHRNSMANPGFSHIATNHPFPTIQFVQTTSKTHIDVPDLSLDFLNRSNLQILSSCNGLLCIKARRSGRKSLYFMCNPLTRKWSLIPRPNGRYWKTNEAFGLAFDPLHYPQAYKLVCVNPRDRNGSQVLWFSVFSSDTGKWTTSKEKIVVPEIISWYLEQSVLAGGVLYWLLGEGLVWFDPHRDLAGYLSTPAIKDGLRVGGEALGVCEDRITYTRVVDEKIVEAWMMVEFQWKRIFRVSPESIQGISSGETYGFFLPYQGEELVYFYYTVLHEDTMRNIIYHDKKTGEITKSDRYQGRLVVHYYPYNYSLFCIPKRLS